MMRLLVHLKLAYLATLALVLNLGITFPARANTIDTARWGMVWTQTAGTTVTEDFSSIDDVFLNGGLDTGGNPLFSGYYYVTITTDLAGLNKLISSYPVKPVYVTLGSFQQPYKLLGSGGIFPAATIQKDTYYYVWIGKNPFTLPPCYPEVDRCRFRIIDGNEQSSTLQAYKYWDLNNNAQWDADAPYYEPPIENWWITVYDAEGNLVETKQTDVNGLASFSVDPGDYTIDEENRTGWLHTTLASITVSVPPNGNAVVYFGNRVDDTTRFARTPGFWQGPQGRKLINADDLQALRDLNLVDIYGNTFNPINVDQLSDWFNSSPQNLMAFKLSRFLAAMTLNIRHNFISLTDDVFISSFGILTIDVLLTKANAALVAPWDVVLQTQLKDALDAVCNNKNWII